MERGETNLKRLTYDGKSYFLDGKRIWLVCGEMHYFRVPRQYWRDRMKKAKENGINCISTYMAWNLHEPSPDCYDFSGEKDIEAYIRTAQEEGLYIILRPGPYICSEVDFGGLPAYLTKISGPYRTWNPEFSQRYEAYFRKILPRLSQLDAEHGGNILLIQNENEHIMPEIEGRKKYFQDLSRIFRECGFEIPIIHCNRMFEGTVEGAIECVNTWDDPLPDIAAIRKVQPNAPQLITELWCGGCDAWRHEFVRRSPWEAWQRTMAITLYGAQYTYYMWHGGTNFDFQGGRLQYEKDYYMITSYDLDAPLSEGGVRGEKYYITGLSNKFALSFGNQLCQMNRKCWNMEKGIKLKVWDDQDDWEIEIDFSKEKLAGVRFADCTLHWNHHVVSFQNLIPLWKDEENLYFYSDIGEASIVIDGADYHFTVTDRESTWDLQEGTIHVLPVKKAMCQSLVAGKLTAAGEKAEKEKFMELPDWQLTAEESPCQKSWSIVSEPMGAEALEQYYGYLWYRFTIPSEIEDEKKLAFFQGGDRFTVYQEGKVCGIWGPGEPDGFSGIPVRLHTGENHLYVLCDNLGRLTHSYKIGEKKGLYGAPNYTEPLFYSMVSEGEEIPCNPPKLIDWSPDEKNRSYREIEYEFTYSGEGSVHIQLEMECCAEVWVNQKYFGLEQNPGIGYADIEIPNPTLQAGKNSLVFRLYSPLGHKAIKKMTVTQEREIPGLAISWSKWEEPMRTAEKTGAYPGWYRLKLSHWKWDGPAFIQFPDGCKGQLYVQEFPIGRIWSGKPQNRYYIPEYLLNGEVEMRYFSENGTPPDGCILCGSQHFQDSDFQTETLDVI